MPRFQFRVTDSEGKARRGTIEAPSLSDARAAIEKRGFYILELKDASEAEPAVQVHAPRNASRYHVGPAPPRPYQPGLGERLAALLPPAHVVKAALALLGALGLLWMVTSWKSAAPGPKRGPAAPGVPQPQLNAYKIQLFGQVAVQGSGALGDVQIVVEIPEVPLQQTFEWARLEHPSAARFEAQLEFQTTRKARRMLVTARKPGFGEAAPMEVFLKPGGGVYKDLTFTVVPKR